MANFDPFDVHGMIVWNDRLLRRWNGHLLRRRRRVLMLIDCFYFWGFSLKLHLLTIWKWFLLECWWLMSFFKKNLIKWMCMGADQRFFDDVRKLVKWMWCCYRVMSRQAVDFDVRNAAFDRETIRCSGGCLIVRTASDADVIRCTGGWMWCQDCCIWSWNDQMHADDCLLMKLSELYLMSMTSDALTVVLISETLHSAPSRSDERQLMPKLLHSIAMRLDALTVIFDVRATASDVDVIKCTDDCLIVKLLHSTVKRSNARWRLSVDAN